MGWWDRGEEQKSQLGLQKKRGKSENHLQLRLLSPWYYWLVAAAALVFRLEERKDYFLSSPFELTV